MSPPVATFTEQEAAPSGKKVEAAPPQPAADPLSFGMSFPKPPKFEDKYKEREYIKGRLAAAFRIFGKYGFDEGVAGHITMRVSTNHRLQKSGS